MSSIDERIVKMEFDNKQFESGVKTTMETLDEFKKSLDFDSQVRSLNDLQKAGNSFNFDGVSGALDTVISKFDALGVVGAEVIRRITDGVIDLGVKIANELVFDNITEGFDKYESKTKTMSTIVNQSGRELEDVEDAVKGISWYADVTSYSLDAMTSALSKFVSNGMDLDASIPIIMGIGNSMSYAGKAAEEAASGYMWYSRALTGDRGMTLRIYQSLESLGVIDKELKQRWIDTAKELGTLEEDSEITIENLRDSLDARNEAWLTPEVLGKVFAEQYGSAADALYNFKESYEASHPGEVLSTIDEIKAAYEADGGTIEDFGLKALQAATNARTLAEAINAVKDAASTQFMEIFEQIFGNVEEAIEFWNNFSDILSSVFVDPIANLKELFKGWKALGGRDAFLQILDILTAIGDLVGGEISAAFREFFPKKTAEDLYNATIAMRDFFARIRLGITKELPQLRIIFEAIFSVVKLITTLAGRAWKIVKNIASLLKPVVGLIYKGLVWFSGLTKTASDFLMALLESGTVYTIFDNLASKIKNIDRPFQFLVELLKTNFQLFKDAGGGLAGTFEFLYGTVKDLGKAIRDVIQNLTGLNLTNVSGKISANLEGVRNLFYNYVLPVFAELSEKIKNTEFSFDGLTTFLDFLIEKFKMAKDFIGGVVDWIKDKVGTLFGSKDETANAEKAASGLDKFKDALIKVKDVLVDLYQKVDINKILEIFKSIIGIALLFNTNRLLSGIADVPKGLAAIETAVSSSLRNISNAMVKYLGALGTKVKAEAILKIAEAIALLAASLLVISFIPTGSLINAVVAISALMLGLATVVKSFGAINLANAPSMLAIGAVFVEIGLGITFLASALKTISEVKPEQLIDSLMTVAVIMLGTLGVMKELSLMKGEMAGGVGIVLFAMAVKMIVDTIASLKAVDQDAFNKMLMLLTFMGLITGVILAAQNIGAGNASPKAFLTLSAAMVGVAFAIKEVASIQGDITQAAVTLEIMLGVMTVMMILSGAVLKSEKEMVAFAAAMAILGVALIEISAAVAILSQLGGDNIQGATNSLMSLLAVMGGILLVLGAISGGLGGIGIASILASAAAMVIMAGAVNLLVPALVILGQLGKDKVDVAIHAIAGALVAIGVAALILTPVVTTLFGIAAVFASIAAVAVGVGLGLVLIGEGLALLAAGLVLIIPAIRAFFEGLASLHDAVSAWLQSVADLIIEYAPKFAEVLGAIGSALLTVVRDFLPKLASIIVEGLLWIIDTIGQAAGAIVIGLGRLLINLINALASWIRESKEEIIGALLNLIGALFELVLEAIGRLASGLFGGIADIFSGGLQAIGDLIGGNIGDWFGNLGKNIDGNKVKKGTMDFMNGGPVKLIKTIFSPEEGAEVSKGYWQDGFLGGFKFTGTEEKKVSGATSGITGFLANIFSPKEGSTLLEGFFGGAEKATETGTNSIMDLLNGLPPQMKDKLSKDLEAAGIYAGSMSMKGLAKGINDNIYQVEDSAKKAGIAATKKLNYTLEVKSPSKVTMKTGKFFALGFAKGIDDNSKSAVNSAESLGETTADMLMDVVSGLDDLDATPVITPIMDLSNIEAGATRMNSMITRSPMAATIADVRPQNNAEANAILAEQLFGLRSDLQTMSASNTDQVPIIAEAVKQALLGMGIYMDEKSVGKIVSNYQSNTRRAYGL